MRSVFWTKTIWYLVLAAASLAMFCAALVRSENRRFTVAFTAATVGLFYIFEYFLVMTDAYAYSPGVFRDDKFLDTYMGNVFSQTSIAAASALIISYRLRLRWMAVFAAAYFAVEMLFSALGIFSTYWYKPFYTPIILVPLFAALKKWHNTALAASREIDGFLLHVLGMVAVSANTVSFPLRLLNLIVMSGKFYSDPSKDHTTTGLLYILIILVTLVLAWRSKRRGLWVPVASGVLFGMQYACWKVGLVRSPERWFIPVTVVFIGAVNAWVCFIGTLVRTRAKTGDRFLTRSPG